MGKGSLHGSKQQIQELEETTVDKATVQVHRQK